MVEGISSLQVRKKDEVSSSSLSFPKKFILGLVILFLYELVYQKIGEMTSHRHYELITELDNAIPFLPWTIWLYLGAYFLLFLIPFAMVKDAQMFFKGVKAIILAIILTFPIFFIMPSTFPRPAVPEEYLSTFSGKLLKFFYDHDPPNNTFPSLHVCLAWLVTFFAFKVGRRTGIITAILAVLVTLSCLTVKQHYLVDLPAGFLMAVITYRLYLKS